MQIEPDYKPTSLRYSVLNSEDEPIGWAEYAHDAKAEGNKAARLSHKFRDGYALLENDFLEEIAKVARGGNVKYLLPDYRISVDGAEYSVELECVNNMAHFWSIAAHGVSVSLLYKGGTEWGTVYYRGETLSGFEPCEVLIENIHDYIQFVSWAGNLLSAIKARYKHAHDFNSLLSAEVQRAVIQDAISLNF